MFNYFIQQSYFVFRFRFLAMMHGNIRKVKYKCFGMKVGNGTYLPKLYITWPHQISIGNNCILEHDIYFKFDGIWQLGPSIQLGDRVFIGSGCEFNIRLSISIGDNALIASGCRFIDHDHGTELSRFMHSQPGIEKSIIIGTDVWLGCNVVVLKGVAIDAGAVVAAGAVVTKSIGKNEIWAGVPARKIGMRQ